MTESLAMEYDADLVSRRASLAGIAAAALGGGLVTLGAATITDATLEGNTAAFSAGIDNRGTLTVVRSTVAATSSGSEVSAAVQTHPSSPATARSGSSRRPLIITR